LIKKPKFKSNFHVEVVEPHNVFLLTENQYWVLSGPLYAALAPFLQREAPFYTVREIMEQAGDQFAATDIVFALDQMEKKGYITEATPDIPEPLAAFAHLLGVEPAAARQRLQKTAVHLRALGTADAAPLQAALTALDVSLVSDGDSQLDVLVVDDYLQDGLEAYNRAALSSGKPWLLVRLIGFNCWIGPIFQPNKSACWECMANRIRTNRRVESYILRQNGRQSPLPTAKVALPTSIQLGAQMAATEIFKWIVSGQNPQLHNQLLTYNLNAVRLQPHPIVRRPQCPACGDPAAYQQPKAIELQSQRAVQPGSHRTQTAEDTLKRFEHHISPITGPVTWLVDITGKTEGLAYTYSAGHTFTLARDTLHYLRQSLVARTGGKGRSEIQAKVSALCEALERYTGVYRGDEYRIRSSYNQLGKDAIHLQNCLHFSEKQYAGRDEWNAQLQGARFNVVPNRLDENQELDWTPLWSLTHQQFKYLPTSFCYYGHPESAEFFFCAGDSNGIAAGNSIEEAILSAFMELVERDGMALWWYNRVQRPQVDLATFRLPYLEQIQAFYHKLNREIWVIDVTTDLNIPVMVALSRRTDRQPEDIILGSAASLDPTSALLGAIVEMNQFLPAIMEMAPDGSTAYNYPDQEGIQWWTNATVASEPYLLPNPQLPAKRLSDYRQQSSGDLKEDILTCVQAAAQVGVEVLALDQTRPDIGLSVARVVAPGLRHFWRRLGPGRLYDIPVQLGWLDRPRQEEELNPYSIFY
jgi:bacteriocin biosynthesis cyclodehydratase domain-containing protein